MLKSAKYSENFLSFLKVKSSRDFEGEAGERRSSEKAIPIESRLCTKCKGVIMCRFQFKAKRIESKEQINNKMNTFFILALFIREGISDKFL
jgi:hypothetical protein